MNAEAPYTGRMRSESMSKSDMLTFVRLYCEKCNSMLPLQVLMRTHLLKERGLKGNR